MLEAICALLQKAIRGGPTRDEFWMKTRRSVCDGAATEEVWLQRVRGADWQARDRQGSGRLDARQSVGGRAAKHARGWQ